MQKNLESIKLVYVKQGAAVESVLKNINILFVRNGKEIEYKQAYQSL